MHRRALVWLALVGTMVTFAACAQPDPLAEWVARFAFREPPASTEGVCTGIVGDLPSFTAHPEATGHQLVRVSLPFPPAALPANMALAACAQATRIPVSTRTLTWHPGRPLSVRRAIVTFPYEFTSTDPHEFTLAIAGEAEARVMPETALDEHGRWSLQLPGAAVVLGVDSVRVDDERSGVWAAQVIAPPRASDIAPTAEVIEWGAHYQWVRLLVPDADWPRIIELRADALGAITLQVHLQRRVEGDDTAPDIGWHVTGLTAEHAVEHSFTNGDPLVLPVEEGRRVLFPLAPYQRRGTVRATTDDHEGIQYLRCHASDKVAFQNTAWRKAAIVVTPQAHGGYTALLESDLKITASPEAFDAIYHSGVPLDLASWPELDGAIDHAWHALKNAMIAGDDFGNITAYDAATDGPGHHAMMRINNAVPMFHAAYRRGDRALRDTALLWCSNTYDLGLWWGDTNDIDGWQRDYSHFGGTRHPISETTTDDPNFQWRKNPAFDFCTKGFDSFFFAYEASGDPRMSTALHWQIDYAKNYIRADKDPGQTRNVGVVADFLHLYEFTGIDEYRDEALRLFRELRTRLSDNHLFSQSGEPIDDEIGFIDDDEHGYAYQYAKPYIMGYALQGLPWLLDAFPDEPQLRDVVRATADFLAGAQDPTGGWRYPHPASSLTSYAQAHEMAAVIARAAAVLDRRGESIDSLLDAIERTLQTTILTYRKTGTFLTTLSGWEISTGAIADRAEIYGMYSKPEDRDPARDYTEGTVATTIIAPEGAASLYEALQFYLSHRPYERLYSANAPARAVLSRLDDRRIQLQPMSDGTKITMRLPDDPGSSLVIWGPAHWGVRGDARRDAEDTPVQWDHDEASGAWWYTLENERCAMNVTFVPRHDVVETFVTLWPVGHGQAPDRVEYDFTVDAPGFAGNADRRAWAFKEGRVSELIGEDGPETSAVPQPAPGMIAVGRAENGRVLGMAQADVARVTASGSALRVHTIMEPRQHIPTTLRGAIYMRSGELEGMQTRFARDASRWASASDVPPASAVYHDSYGVRERMPRWYEARTRERTFDLAWEHAAVPFDTWREQARETQHKHFGEPPTRVPFNATVLDEERRDGYVAQKIALNINAYCRIPAYLLIPDGDGPFPGIVALHDHGAHFFIGKEKVVRPFKVSPEVEQDSMDWVTNYYGGHYIGDELAKRGYVVLSIDVIFWGERGRMEGVEFQEQQALAANMLQLGHSWAGYNAWDDIRSAEFLQSVPQVDPDRIGCVGLSMGAYRTWQLCAATDIVKAGAVICWMGDLEGFMVPGQNQTAGQSSFSMIHPGLFEDLDYPDVASIACPKPMLFFAGLQDTLFAVDSVERCFGLLRRVWTSQGAEDRLVCKLFDVPHLFNEDMQTEAFGFLDQHLKE